MRLADEVVRRRRSCAPGSGWSTASCGCVPEARVGHLGMYRDEEALRPVGYYENIPSGVEDAEVFVRRPDARHRRQRASQAIARLKRAGAQRLHFVCLVAAPEGVAALREAHPDVPIMTAADRPRARRATATSARAWATRATASSAPPASSAARA